MTWKKTVGSEIVQICIIYLTPDFKVALLERVQHSLYMHSVVLSSLATQCRVDPWQVYARNASWQESKSQWNYKPQFELQKKNIFRCRPIISMYIGTPCVQSEEMATNPKNFNYFWIQKIWTILFSTTWGIFVWKTVE